MNVLRSSELSLALLIACSVKMTCLLGFAWIIATAARRRSAAFRHLVWSSGILGSLTLTFAHAAASRMALGHAVECHRPFGFAAWNGERSQFPVTAFDDGRRGCVFSAVEQGGHVGTVYLGRRLLNRLIEARGRYRATCMGIRTLKATTRRALDARCFGDF